MKLTIKNNLFIRNKLFTGFELLFNYFMYFYTIYLFIFILLLFNFNLSYWYFLYLFFSFRLFDFFQHYFVYHSPNFSLLMLKKEKDFDKFKPIFLDFQTLELESKSLSQNDQVTLMTYIKNNNKDINNTEYNYFLSNNLIFITQLMEDKEWIFKIKSFNEETLLMSEDLSGYAQIVGKNILEEKLLPTINLIIKYNRLEYYFNIEKIFPDLYKKMVVNITFEELLKKIEIHDKKEKRYFYLKNNYAFKTESIEVHWMQKYINTYQKEIMNNFKEITLRLKDKDWLLKTKFENEYKILKNDNIYWYSNIASPIDIKEKFKNVLSQLETRDKFIYKKIMNILFDKQEDDLRNYNSNLFKAKYLNNFLNSKLFDFKSTTDDIVKQEEIIEQKEPNVKIKNRIENNIIDHIKPFLYILLTTTFLNFIVMLNLKYKLPIIISISIITILYMCIITLFMKNIDRILKIEYEEKYFLENIDIIEKDKVLIHNLYSTRKKFWLKKYFKRNQDFFLKNCKTITNKIKEKNWLLLVNADHRKIIQMEDLEWYSNVVSKHQLYDYLLDTIVDIVENQEYEYYEKLESVFSDIMHDKILQEVRTKSKK